MPAARLTLGAALAVIAPLLVSQEPAVAGVDPGPAVAPRMEFVAPAAGTYRLQHIQGVADAGLLDDEGRPVRLAALTHGKITLLTFFYTYCVDPLGCPFAHVTLAALRDRVRADHALDGRVRFVSVSLDPTHDTPGVIQSYGRDFRIDPRFDWRFVTARNVQDLVPVLDDFGQDVSVDLDEQGRATRALHHMLKMFLLDASGEVREIYTLAYLQPDVMFNDMKTLALEVSRPETRTAKRN